MSWTKGESITLPNNIKAQQFQYPKNGMKVIICEMHTAPITGYMRVVNAGSAMENGVCGKGIAHFIEHMSFRIDDGKYWKFEKEGHEDNAMTTEDATSFYDFGHYEHIKDVISVDGHRFRTNEVPADGIPVEMHAVLNEEERGRQASGVLFRTAQASSHLYDRYHYPTIGMRHDIINTTAQDMQTFREKFYKLNNSTFIIVGHVNTKEILDHFENVYGKIPMEEEVKHDLPEEPLQTGKRIININMPAPCSMLCLTWVSPSAKTRESVALSVLQRIISNGDHGRKKELIDSGAIHNVGCYAPRNVNAYIFCLHGAFGLHDKKTLEKGESKLHNMLDSIATGLSQNELDLAKKTIETEWNVMPFKNIHTTTMALGEAVALGNWKDISSRVQTLKSITVEDVKQVIKNYLSLKKSTSVRLFPQKEEDTKPSTTVLESPVVETAEVGASLKPLQWTCESKLFRSGKAKLQTLEISNNDSYCSFSVPFEHSERYAAMLTADLLGNECKYKGITYNGASIVSKMADLGLDMDCASGLNHFNVSFVFRKQDKMNEACDFMVNGIMKNSMFSHNDVNSKKRTNMAELAALRKNQQYICKRELITRLFKDTSYNEKLDTKISKLNRVTNNHIDHFYSTVKNCKEWNCTFVYQKGMEQKVNIDSIMDTCLCATKNKSVNVAQVAWEPKVSKQDFTQKVMQGFGTSMVLMGQVTDIQHYTREAVALSLAVKALGGGMTARLMSILRGQDGDKNGVYGVYASMYEQKHAPVYVVVNASFTPGLEHHGVKEMKHVVDMWDKKGISEEEFQNSKYELLGQRSLEMDNFESVSSVYHRHLVNDKLPSKEWNEYVKNVSTMTLKEVNNVIKKLKTDKWTIVSTSPLSLKDNFLDDTDDEN